MNNRHTRAKIRQKGCFVVDTMSSKALVVTSHALSLHYTENLSTTTICTGFLFVMVFYLCRHVICFCWVCKISIRNVVDIEVGIQLIKLLDRTEEGMSTAAYIRGKVL